MSMLSRLLRIIKEDFNSAVGKTNISDAENEINQFKMPHKNNSTILITQSYVAPTENLKLNPDYRLLGIKTDSTLDEIDKAWQSLAKRADPKRFPKGSDEEKRAAEILIKINAAYKRIREYKNPTDGRFGNLEL